MRRTILFSAVIALLSAAPLFASGHREAGSLDVKILHCTE